MPSLEERTLAALKVYCLWSWLEAHPDKDKYDYPLLKELTINKPGSLLCPWCAIYIWCRNCPLDVVGERCSNDGNWFNIWIKTSERYHTFTSEDQRIALLNKRSLAAGEIAGLAWKEYKRLGG